MGLLTNPNAGSGGIVSLLERHYLRLGWLCYVIGVAGIFIFPYPEFSHKTYFSENALLPGLVKGEFNEERAMHRYLDDLREESKNNPFPWLKASMTQLGLEVYTHNFTLHYPLGKTENYTGENVYAILRAPRASSTEALVLAVPYRPSNSLEQSTDTSLAVMLATAKFFRRQHYWAKDVIFLVTQHEQLGMQAWLEAYHQTSCGDGILDYGDLPARAGSIQAAINLELSSPDLTHFNIKVEGLNGQLPNLDLVNLVNRLCVREGVGQMFQNVEDHPRPDTMKGYKRSLQTLVTMALKQATGVPTGNHGLFHRFGIEALTIEGVRQKSKRRQVVGLHTVGRVVEGIFRSLNNLLERFHQSFFFYLLPSSNRYVSIGMYMPAFGFLGGALVIAALGMWFQCAREEQFDRAKEAKKAQKAKNCHDEIVSLPVVIPSSVANVLPVIVFAHVIGYLMTVLPNRITKVGAHFRLETDDALAIFVFTYFILTLFLPASLGRAIVVDAKNWRVLKCITLLELAAVAFVVSLSNFSLAYIVCLIYVPFALLAGDNRDGGSSIVWFAKCSFSLLSHPMAMLAVVSTVDTIVNFPDKPLGKLVFMSVDATKRALTYAITDGMIYGNANYVMACVFLVPCWYLLWCQNFVTMENDQNTKEEITTEEDKKTK